MQKKEKIDVRVKKKPMLHRSRNILPLFTSLERTRIQQTITGNRGRSIEL